MTQENFLDMLKQGKSSIRNENSKSNINNPSLVTQPSSGDDKRDEAPTQWGAVNDNFMLLEKQMSLKVIQLIE